jgi:hypothetical protein
MVLPDKLYFDFDIALVHSLLLQLFRVIHAFTDV